MQLDAAGRPGGLGLFRLGLGELRGLPLALAAAYLRERNRQKMKSTLDPWFAHQPGSAKEVLLSVVPFVLTAFVTGLLSFIPAVDQFPMWAGQLILLGLFLVQAGLGIIGLILRLPRWSLPSRLAARTRARRLSSSSWPETGS